MKRLIILLILISLVFLSLQVKAQTLTITPIETPSEDIIRPTRFNNPNRFIKPTRNPTILQENMLERKLRACQVITKNIIRRSTKITETTNKMIEKFDSILQRVKDYYQNKLVPHGKTLSNYESLLTDIDAKKTAVNQAVLDFQTASIGFTCDQNNPGQSMTSIREKMKAVLVSLKNYKTSIKNFIVAVHRQSPDKEPLPTLTIEPTITPIQVEL